MNESRNLDFILATLFGVLVGSSGVYLIIYFFLDPMNGDTAGLWTEHKIKKMVKQEVKSTLDQKCVQYKIAKLDLNSDQAIDLRFVHDGDELTEVHQDRDFDGVFETETIMEHSNRLWTETDTNGNRAVDMEIIYEHNVPKIVVFKNEQTGRAIKIKKLSMDKIIESNMDTDNDGVLDTAFSYDKNEEVVDSYSLAEYPDKLIQY